MGNDDARILALRTPELLKQVTTLVVATKAIYWLANHHTGQGKITGYPRKVYNMWLDAQLFADAAHTIGHWASTKAVLILCGIKDVKPTTPYSGFQAIGTISVGEDILKRFGIWPAGTHRAAVGITPCQKWSTTPAFCLCPVRMISLSCH
jgi:hypothetical protein